MIVLSFPNTGKRAFTVTERDPRLVQLNIDFSIGKYEIPNYSVENKKTK